MPWTFAHPAAILPLKRWFPRFLSLPALIIGSLTPDFGYYINPYDVGDTTHSLEGSIKICVPAGLVFLLLFYAVRRPLWHLLPARPRQAALPLLEKATVFDLKFLVVGALSVQLGAWSHIVWDSFTHRTTWAVQQLPLLQETLFTVGSFDFPTYSVLQHASTVFGTLALVLAYFWWLRRQPADPIDTRGDGWRYFAVIGTVAASFLFAMVRAYRMTGGPTGIIDARDFAVKTAVYGMSAVMMLIALYAIAYYAHRLLRA